MTDSEMIAEARALLGQARAIYEGKSTDLEEIEKANRMLVDAKTIQEKALRLKEIEHIAVGLGEEENPARDFSKGNKPATEFKSLGQWLCAVAQAGNHRYRGPLHQGLVSFNDPTEVADSNVTWLHADAALEPDIKQLVENVGATGGFLVPAQYDPNMLSIVYEKNPIRDMATIIPMRRRQLEIPTVDQTGTTAGATRQHGGIVASWVEEAMSKPETAPSFRKVVLVAHKLVCYTEASDELLADEAVGLVAFLQGAMGFGGAIRWEEEWTFLRGTGAGQPLGVILANATFVQPRAVAGTIGVADIMNMLMHHNGDNPVWHITKGAMATLLQLNGPAAFPSYIFIPNAREGMPATLMGFPIYWTEKLPALGVRGDILLADWKYYLIGDRQATTIDATNIYRFRYDITSYRAVHRVDGKPWLSQPITLADGALQVSPFVILGDVAS